MVKRRLRQFTYASAALVVLVCLLYGGWLLWQRYQATHGPNPTIPTEVITHSTDTPDETPPTEACDNYAVAANEPRKIEVPSIGVSGCNQKVGLDQNNAIAVPTNIHLAGWYTGSKVPSQSGVSIIDGHVLGRYNDAIFKDLKNLRENDIIRVQLGDTSWHEFTVISTGTYSVDKTMDEVYKPFEGESRLVLITCGGTYDRASSSYNERVVVRSILVE